MRLEQWIEYTEEVKEAKRLGKPIVALESTIISHGMPYPQNVNTARDVEQIIRDHGAVPATIGIINGKIKIGLTRDELEFFAVSQEIEKVSRRDLPYILTMNKNGATTVAATMICAKMAGIDIFVTGGIGGVHLEGENTLDISADLTELAQTNVAVVCAGAKSILDIERTLEYLETRGVPVIGYKTDDFPAFYTRTSGFKVDYRIDTPNQMATLIKTKWELGLHGGLVIANPVPEEDAMEESKVQEAIDTALEQAKIKGIKGKKVTPFLLNKVKELTGGISLQTNIALVKHNAEAGAKIAVALNKLSG
ncbi:pseudouridine-5'-phosphate glycosidase [Microaerobacter geothermalis]|uniref:pseudouridine-5'-phosphate glycosidase n=1 Tax=Microaerobacter geothermalis TaxID=674972 RepID=UPI001F174933|nr:pseudouridine-5'-phosphate glycosidase [Microaerobacter geothermalis]MCF6093094.1 pseudouridine-5'-phosphate glycosidase [Microaerobacter geothermalis]